MRVRHACGYWTTGQKHQQVTSPGIEGVSCSNQEKEETDSFVIQNT
ncbi:uncharacterized protein G2W53_004743 [Senna tora]|uniref:Uncharacterized protein n=1 Tax=Senna tora TaxID=362788 RepID=A0A835CJL8_9FABA|nr:uncharacterized protein G2W53_004743 [Senna tora]